MLTGKKSLSLTLGRDEVIQRLGLLAMIAFLTVAVVLPLYALMSQSVQDRSGTFVGLGNYVTYFSTPALTRSLLNSLYVAVSATAIVMVTTFIYAYALTRTCMPFKGVFKVIALVPILSPSLLPAIALIYLFGNQGVLKGMLLGETIYGPIGVIIGTSYWVFPHALMVVMTALSVTDARLYEAANALGSSRLRTFFTVTLPGARYGLISAGFVVFTLAITDYGVPTVVGGQFNVLATDVYKQVIGQQNFQMGAVVSVVMLVPAVVAFVVDRLVQKKQTALLSSRAVPYQPKPNPLLDWTMFALCALIALSILAMIGMAAYASFVTFWPYNQSLTLANYDFTRLTANGWDPYFNTLRMAFYTAVVGTVVVFFGAYLSEKTTGFRAGRTALHLMSMLPLAVPGLVLGLSYIFFFNAPGNPLNGLYGTMAILVLSTIAHFYTVSHLTAVTALKQMDREFESVSASLKAPFYKTVGRVTVPVCLPSILDIFMYLFLNAMTTVSAVIFLSAPGTSLAAIAVVNMADSGTMAPAAAMAMMIVYTALAVKLLHALASWGLLKRTQAWRRQ